MNTTTKEYDYRVRGWSMFYMAGACLLFAGLMAFLAMSGQSSFFGLKMEPITVSRAYWGCTILCIGLGQYLFNKGMRQKKEERKIVLSDDALTLPQQVMSDKFITIPYNSIHSLNMFTPGRSAITIIDIKHVQGRTEISEMGFESKDTLKEIYALLQEKTGKS